MRELSSPYPRNYLRSISKTPRSKSDYNVRSFLPYILYDFQDIVPWCMRLDAIPDSNDLVAESILEIFPIRCLADGIGNYNVHLRRMECVVDVVGAGDGES